MTRAYNKPDLNAPRYRPRKLNFTNAVFFKQFIDKHPRHAGLGLAAFKEIISVFNGKIWEYAVENRDGVELPEQLGFLFIGSCPRKTRSNVDFHKSGQYGVIIQNQNFQSDEFVAKIFYTNYETKYRFKNHDMWGFKGVRDFTRAVGQTYPAEWKKYIVVDNMVRISKLFRKTNFQQFKIKETIRLIDEGYDEFDLT